MKVVSYFDGMSIGQLALNYIGISPAEYIAVNDIFYKT